jgi:hypothetical protein
MDAWVTWAYNDVFMRDRLLWQKVSKPLTEFQSFHNDTDFNLGLHLLTSHQHCNILQPLCCILFMFTTAGTLQLDTSRSNNTLALTSFDLNPLTLHLT